MIKTANTSRHAKTIARYGCTLRIYDNGGKTFDRYTCIPPRWAGSEYKEGGFLWSAIGASEDPFTGFGLHVTAAAGLHLGRRINWASLPEKVKKFAKQSFPEFCPVEQSA